MEATSGGRLHLALDKMLATTLAIADIAKIRFPTHSLKYQGVKNFTLVARLTREPHVSCTWGAPLHHWLNATCEGITLHVSHTWAVREPHVSCTWGAPLHHWLNATHEGITLHVRHMRAVREPHVSCTWGAPLHHWLNATREGITVHVSHMWAVCEPHISCTWGAPLHHWLNATCEGITLHVSHTWAVREHTREGLPSTIDWMLHVRALPCTWATRELYVSHT